MERQCAFCQQAFERLDDECFGETGLRNEGIVENLLLSCQHLEECVETVKNMFDYPAFRACINTKKAQYSRIRNGYLRLANSAIFSYQESKKAYNRVCDYIAYRDTCANEACVTLINNMDKLIDAYMLYITEQKKLDKQIRESGWPHE
ncbi:hypothetical protein [Butyrivibrio sp. NC2007]|uniref:hypothetical protein n=1 Tax=Butyrivibrio sp. NC2007 TaxID=1280683 RepID=UPI0003B661FA|nr:hypothetical protein [Butyrivibrio sp. NC2007]